jgi:DsbC/DsbD-like thiol-disulfide interchange protein
MRRTLIRRAGTIVLLLALALTWALSASVGEAGKKSDAVVKASAAAGKPDADNKQVVTVTLVIDKGWHIYANPVGAEDLAAAQTVVTVSGKTKPEKVTVAYPPGDLVKDKTGLEYRTYEGKVEIKATVQRAAGNTEPLDVTVEFSACNDKSCLQPAKVKLAVK